MNVSEFIRRSNEVHKFKYDYSKVRYVNLFTPVEIICPIHGEFSQTPDNHFKGKGCPICGNEKRAKSNTYSFEEFVKRAREVHGDKYIYNENILEDKESDKIKIICPEHGEFSQNMAVHLRGNGCPHCAGNAKMDTEEFIRRAREIHGDEYDYSKVNYINTQTKVCIICPKHGEFWQTPNNHLIKGYGCPMCSSNRSKGEREVVSFLQSLGFENIECNKRTIVDGIELDMFLPEVNVAIEYDGLYWHNELKVDKNYHLNKTNECNKHGIHLIHIFEDEWHNKQDIVKSMISNAVNKSPDRIFARKCKIKTVNEKDKKVFLIENHLQGDARSSINLGLYYDGELVSLMTFCAPRVNLGRKNEEGTYELLRFCSKINFNVVGGASKLFKSFLRDYNPRKIITYSDNRWAIGKTYEKLGFKLMHISKPNYFYVVKNERENRFKYRKDRLVLEGFDKNKTEHEIMLERGIYRIYDCGCKVWEFYNDKSEAV